MPYIYQYGRHHSPFEIECETLKDAINLAAAHLEYNDAWPEKITGPDGAIIWEPKSFLETSRTLEQLAKTNGVRWPCI